MSAVFLHALKRGVLTMYVLVQVCCDLTARSYASTKYLATYLDMPSPSAPYMPKKPSSEIGKFSYTVMIPYLLP